jgi:glutaconate CoA-transferase subunit B
VDVAFLGVGQIDKYGNVNSSYVGGTPGNYEMRLTGAGGAPEFLAYARRSVFTMKSGQFVNKLDYMTSPGYLTGGDSRYMAGMPLDSGPSLLVTQDAVFKFDPITKEMFLAGLHPGVKVETVKAKIPWDLKIADKLEVTVPPTEEEVKFIRTYGPDVSMGRKLQIEAIVNQVFRMIEKMEKQKNK